MIDGEVLYCSPGGKKNNVVALNKNTGELIWSCPGKEELSAYCSPLLVNLPDRKLLVTMSAKNILGIDATTGKLLWSYGHTNRHDIQANTPIYYDGAIFCSSGSGGGSVKLKLNEDGSSVTKDWFNSSLDCKIGGIVLVDGYIYGAGDNNAKWICVDWKTGETIYESSAITKGAVIAAEGKLYGYSEKGDLVLAYTLNQHTSKLKKQGMGPYVIHDLLTSGAVHLATLDVEPMTNWISGCRLKKYRGELADEILCRLHATKDRKQKHENI